jgi:FRG domain
VCAERWNLAGGRLPFGFLAIQKAATIEASSISSGETDVFVQRCAMAGKPPMRRTILSFNEVAICTWDQFSNAISHRAGDWIYRGQVDDQPLTTTLERAMKDWEADPKTAPEIERQVIRDFRRRYRGDAQDRIMNTRFCLAIMQHHGAPTRLLDWTYSPFVAAKFAIERGRSRGPVIWCLNADWCINAATSIDTRLKKRDVDKTRNDKSFVPIYMNSRNQKKFVYPENAFYLNERLTIQQGVFLCAGDITATFAANLKALDGWDLETSVLKLQLRMDKLQIREFAHVLRNMNISSAALFPGLDGVARSLCEYMFHYEEFACRRVGTQAWRPKK